MDFAFLKSPWVIGAGLGLGALVLLSRGSSGGSSGGTDYNRASLDLVAQQSAIGADVEKTRILAGASLGSEVVAAIGNLVNAQYAHDLGLQQVAAGIAQTRIAAGTALRLERMNTIIRGKEIQAGLNIAKLDAVTRLAGQREQDSTTLKLQSNKESSNFFDSIKGIVSKLL